MSVEKIRLTPFSDKNFAGLIGLTLSTYPGREISDVSYLCWEYVDNPDGPAIINTAKEGNAVIAQYIVIPRKYSVNNNKIQGSLSVNTLTHSDYRGLNLFATLAEETFRQCAEKKIQFTIGFPNPLSLPVIDKKKIFEIIGYLPLLIRPLSPIRSVIKYVSGKRNKEGNEIQLNIPKKFKSNDISLVDLNEDIDHYEIFLEKFNKQNLNVTYRSISFLRWRYVNIPLREYHILKIKNGSEIMAAAVIRSRFMYGLRTLILIDIFSIDILYSRKLIEAMDEIARGNNIDLIISTVPSHTPEYKIFKKAGYYSLPAFLMPQKLAVIVRRHNSSCPSQISDFKKWFLTFGDYDIF